MGLKNLAGVATCDEYIQRELSRVGLPALVQQGVHQGEVPYTVYGQLKNLQFTRAWSYWCVEGYIPLELAKILYEDPVRDEIRARGYAGGLSPDVAGVLLTLDGKIVLSAEEWQESLNLLKKYPQMVDLSPYVGPEDEQATTARWAVGGYHIDSELALRVFVDAVKAHSKLMDNFNQGGV